MQQFYQFLLAPHVGFLIPQKHLAGSPLLNGSRTDDKRASFFPSALAIVIYVGEKNGGAFVIYELEYCISYISKFW